mmetsp:Transcript_1295/g.2566  ORF Transcript_1295/g.2566 Transcript_1295/m.2566 type:complete len:263 (-) Transcript_1295:256-1044(-)
MHLCLELCYHAAPGSRETAFLAVPHRYAYTSKDVGMSLASCSVSECSRCVNRLQFLLPCLPGHVGFESALPLVHAHEPTAIKVVLLEVFHHHCWIHILCLPSHGNQKVCKDFFVLEQREGTIRIAVCLLECLLLLLFRLHTLHQRFHFLFSLHLISACLELLKRKEVVLVQIANRKELLDLFRSVAILLKPFKHFSLGELPVLITVCRIVGHPELFLRSCSLHALCFLRLLDTGCDHLFPLLHVYSATAVGIYLRERKLKFV